MGQAKNRGSYEERKAESIRAAEEVQEKRRLAELNMTPEERAERTKRIKAMQLLTEWGLYNPKTIEKLLKGKKG